MKLPHRVILFTWKCLKNVVPTRERLAQHNHSIEQHCSVCQVDEESLFHLLLTCIHAKAVWRLLNINIDQVIMNYHNIQDWIISWFINVSNSNSEELDILMKTLMVACWIIWKEKCECVFEDKTLNPLSTVARIKFQLISFSSIPRQNIDSQASVVHRNCFSNMPVDVNSFTIYVDASFGYDTNDCGTGMVLVSTAGEITGLKGSYAYRIRDSEEWECAAILEAVRWFKALGHTKINIIDDAQNVVNSITSDNLFVRWEYRKTVRDIKLLLNSFSFWSFNHIMRVNNG
ncbi:uncharacterized protein LOC113295233 [Papaver somniferum]|uniref:uncharacterized protein LOC113295233 n=1 Tax=Papaver somniferum TaxID=3469 RepID=UPI000E6F7A56|nr:uncharacterized protein LOC113295233 [Papaver somniferum]